MIRRAPIGQAAQALVGALAALVLCAILWGFTVDDALIAVRYARHLASGHGYRFNAGGPSTDGVTPLPWAFLLAPLARADALSVLWRAKVVGLLAWLVAAGAWGAAVIRAEAPAWMKGAAFLALAMCIPVAAYAVSGMETPIATALATIAAVSRRPYASSVCAGLAAAFRPEMAAWAIAVGAGRKKIAGAAIALAPFAVCAVVRLVVWGRAAPLAVMAKPSDLSHGLAYAGAAALVSLGPIFALAPWAAWKTRDALLLLLAGVLHFAAIAAAGGDWMPYARLAAPVAPSLLYAGVLVRAHVASSIARAALTLIAGVFFLWNTGFSARRVSADRERLVTSARPRLQNARTVAALDIGWVSASTDATIVDLAGLTDPAIAALPGGHTSKRVDVPLLLERDPDVLLLYAPARVVEMRFLRSELIAERFDNETFLPLSDRGAGYVLLRRVR